MLPTCSTWAHFSDAYSLTVMIKFHISWSFLRFVIPWPLSYLDILILGGFLTKSALFCLLLLVCVSILRALFLVRHGPSFIESCCLF